MGRSTDKEARYKQRLKSDIEAFLANGGVIQYCGPMDNAGYSGKAKSQKEHLKDHKRVTYAAAKMSRLARLHDSVLT